jgi:hypothetical protein
MIAEIYDGLEIGDIIQTHFIDRTKFKKNIIAPYIKDPLNPKHRYCLVAGKYASYYNGKIYYFILTIYGTSKDTSSKQKTDEILLSTSSEINESNLKVATKWIFSPSNIAILPINKTFFCMNNIKIGKMTRKKVKYIFQMINTTEVINIEKEIQKNLKNKMMKYNLWNDKEYNINKLRDNYKFDE